MTSATILAAALAAPLLPAEVASATNDAERVAIMWCAHTNRLAKTEALKRKRERDEEAKAREKPFRVNRSGHIYRKQYNPKPLNQKKPNPLKEGGAK